MHSGTSWEMLIALDRVGSDQRPDMPNWPLIYLEPWQLFLFQHGTQGNPKAKIRDFGWQKRSSESCSIFLRRLSLRHQAACGSGTRQFDFEHLFQAFQQWFKSGKVDILGVRLNHPFCKDLLTILGDSLMRF